jgi:hypothetical protein
MVTPWLGRRACLQLLAYSSAGRCPFGVKIRLVVRKRERLTSRLVKTPALPYLPPCESFAASSCMQT